jgi:cytochrome b involved in lipid metabolism
VDGVVYDLTSFEELHPGGPKILKAYYGKDATRAFHGGVHAHTVVASSMLSQYRVGRVVTPA